PYNIGRSFYGNPTGGAVTSITEPVTTNFLGGANAELRLGEPTVSNNLVTLVWSATEGGTYRLESAGTLNSWVTNATGIAPTLNRGTFSGPATETNQFFRISRTALGTY